MTVRTARVLLVEDDSAIRDYFVGPLEAAWFEVLTAADAAEALEVLAQRRVDVVVADYHLPGVTGLDLLAAIRGTAPGTALILYSGGMTEDLANEARGFDVAAVLEKPVTGEQLIEAIRAAGPRTGVRGGKVGRKPRCDPAQPRALTRAGRPA